MWARIHLIPALQAEEDRDQVRRYLADKARERELLGSETKVYNSDRYGIEFSIVPPPHILTWLLLGLSDRLLQLLPSTRRNKQNGSRKQFPKACAYRDHGVPRNYFVRIGCFNNKIHELELSTL
jgi:hypothetical protein